MRGTLPTTLASLSHNSPQFLSLLPFIASFASLVIAPPSHRERLPMHLTHLTFPLSYSVFNT